MCPACVIVCGIWSKCVLFRRRALLEKQRLEDEEKRMSKKRAKEEKIRAKMSLSLTPPPTGHVSTKETRMKRAADIRFKELLNEAKKNSKKC
mmetsp:Transcript_39437/g.101097  ORF Transcript_39437/g.101097 Transcript_39437/m.101097 type:complete len:92 (+) Transcript_39437:156-431(+)